MRAARARGFLAVVEEAASRDAAAEILSPAGRAALRDVLIAGAGPNVRRDAANGASRTRGAGRKRAEKLAADFGAPPQRPLDRMSLVEQLRARKDSQGQPLLTDAQVAAAQRFAQDFAIGQMQPRVTARWAVDAMPEPRRRSAPGAGVEVAAATAAAQARVRKAMAHLGGEMAGLVLDVCCFEHGLEEIEAARHWPARSARIALRFALTALAMYYGLIVPPRDGVAPIRQWAELDFKPNANAWKTL